MNCEDSARVLHDGTNELAVNRNTRLRDQERCPVSSDLKRAMREKASRGLRTFALTADVKEAHRQIPIDPRDWHLLGCQLECGADVFINTAGTLGITSASYYWSRVASALGWLTQCLASDRAETWHMIVADDFHLGAGRMHYRLALMMFFIVCSVVGAPFSWHKTRGGDSVVWVGFELLHRTRHLAARSTKVSKVGARDGFGIHPHGKVRGGTWQDNVCCLSPGAGTPLPRTIVQVHGPPPTTIDEKSPCLRHFHPALPRGPSGPVKTLQLFGDPGEHDRGAKGRCASQ